MKITEIQVQGLIRLIPEEYRDPPVLRKLVDSDEEAEVLDELVGETDVSRVAEQGPSPAPDSHELAFTQLETDPNLYGESHINMAFTRVRPSGNRFNGADRGAWYCSYDIETSASEVGFHRMRELRYAGVAEDEALYFELLADFTGEFPDLDGQQEHPALDPDMNIGYPEGQALAGQLRRKGHSGLLYPSVRHQGGRCLVAFERSIIQNVRPGANWKLTLANGAENYSIARA